MGRLVACLCVGVILALPSIACIAADGDAAAILAAQRKATGAFPNGTVTMHWTHSGQGLEGSVDQVFDARNGFYVERGDLPPTRYGYGFDGKLAWQSDVAGMALPEQGGDRPQVAANNAYRYANAWWRPDFGGAKVESLGRDADGDHLRVAPRDGKPFDAWFDARTHLLARVRDSLGFQAMDLRYRDYARHDAVMVPGTITIDDGSGPSGLRTLALASIALSPPRDAAAYAMPRVEPRDWTLHGDGQTVLPMRLLNNHVYVDVQVDGKGPFPFIVDTGGHAILTPATVQALGLDTVGAVTSSGAGAKTRTAGFARVHSLRAGGLEMTDQTMLVLDMSPKDIEGFQMGGMLGMELLQRLVARFDYGAGTLTLVDPARFDPKDAGTAVPFLFYDHLPFVQGRFAGLPARFDIDTGARTEVTLTSPYVAANRLRERFAHKVSAIDGWGVGGATRSELVRAPWLELGDVRVPGVIAGLSDARKGVFSDPNFDGNIGSGLLKRFVVTFDYGHQVMYLKPLAKPDAGADADIGTFDRSGMWLNLADDGYAVAAVVDDGPAARAGIRAGDVIETIDGKGPAQLPLPDARRQLRVMPAGSTVKVAYRRDGRRSETVLTLRDLVPAKPSPLAP